MNVVGQSIRINNVTFKVIGITVSKGGSGFSNPDDTVIVPLSAAQRYLSGSSQYVGTISIAAQSSEAAALVQQETTALLLQRHNIRNPLEADFSTLNQADLISTISGVTQMFTLLLGSVAGISLLVGGIGIMNMMLTTVTERTREIGLRKAIGAKQKDISTQFLIEAVTLTFIGGLIGVILGSAGSYAVAALDIVNTSVSAWSVFLAFGVSAGIGIVFGWYPARRASRLNPIEALRYE
jgi:putative ABC transport system permease protein